MSYTGPSGSPETVLDFMNKYLKKKSHLNGVVIEVSRIRNMLIEDFGAKRFTELPESEQQRYLANKPR